MSEFWRFLDLIYPGNKLYTNGCPEEEDITKFLDSYSFSITDMVYKTDVKKFSTDKELGNISPKDLKRILLGTLWASLKTKMVCESQRADRPMLKKIVLLN